MADGPGPARVLRRRTRAAPPPSLRMAVGASGDSATDRAWAVRRIALDLAAVELLGALADDGIEGILLKGPVTAARQYPDTFRPYLDVDLLVAPDRFEAALACLAGRGLRPGPANERETSMQRAADGVGVDLHRTLAGTGVAPERVWAVLAGHRAGFSLHGHTLQVLDEAAHTCHLALHAVQTGRDKPKPAADLDRAVAGVPMPVWRDALRVAERLGAVQTMAAALRCYASAGAALADELGLPRAGYAARLRSADPSRWSLGVLGWRAAGWPGRLAALRAWVAPGRAGLRARLDEMDVPALARRLPPLLGYAAFRAVQLGTLLRAAGLAAARRSPR